MMGFIYNNVWESFCKTYLELNGYFVLSNVYVSLLDEEVGDARRRRLEADLIAYKIEHTNLERYMLDLPIENQNDDEFFAGIDRADNLIYCEIRANITTNREQANHQDQAIITRLFNRDRGRLLRKFDRINERFNIRPTVVVIAHRISDQNKQRIFEEGWFFKEFPSIYQFMQRRFEGHAREKRRIQYNDPWLEMLRFFDRLAYNHQDRMMEGIE